MPFLGDTPSTTSITAGSPSTLSDTQVFGSGAEADVKIILDGNAVDYHIGVDDSADLERICHIISPILKQSP